MIGGLGGIRFRILSFVSSLKILTNYLWASQLLTEWLWGTQSKYSIFNPLDWKRCSTSCQDSWYRSSLGCLWATWRSLFCSKRKITLSNTTKLYRSRWSRNRLGKSVQSHSGSTRTCHLLWSHQSRNRQPSWSNRNGSPICKSERGWKAQNPTW